VVHLPTRRLCYAQFCDIGPKGKLGEGSMALAEALGLSGSPRHGGTDDAIIAYLVFPGSGDGLPKSRAQIEERGAALFGDFGGIERLMEGVRG
jgi:hypothetical protein